MTDEPESVAVANGAHLDLPRYTLPRFKIVPLQWPLEYAGKTYAEIHLVRLTAKEVAEWMESIKGEETARLPLFRDADGGWIPDAVMEALDDDDRLALDEAAVDFLPRRFRADPASDIGPISGVTTAPSSGA